ncbi:hypothetical protein FNU79_00260 [Deinococcus detaillensis]|uniref:Uncharacterized protein n=1 Tax=Deinococcus detaillensis TaxID=2592048 RepID=A0A553V5J7_9DEIO|nr:hypothetical protein [Deinococcus detaillensis]TSA87737.1 hypothetical protein FNU79_00260 [Deinococcus detaillensis]
MLIALRLLVGLVVLVALGNALFPMLVYDGWFVTSPEDLGIRPGTLLHLAGWTLGLGSLLTLLCWPLLLSLFNCVSTIQKLSLILFFAAFCLIGLAFLSYPYLGLSVNQLLRAYQWTRLLSIWTALMTWKSVWPFAQVTGLR